MVDAYDKAEAGIHSTPAESTPAEPMPAESTHNNNTISRVVTLDSSTNPSQGLSRLPSTQQSKEKGEEGEEGDLLNYDTGIVSWDGETDPEHPRNWSNKLKWLTITKLCFAGLFTSMSVSLMTPAVPNFMVYFDVKLEVAILAYSVSTIGWVFGPMFFAPISEVYGRNAVFRPTWCIFTLLFIGCALSKNIGELLFFRLITGIAGSPFISVIAGSITDLFSISEQATPIGIFTITSYLGPILGPLLGGYITQYASWRWTFWLTVILGGVMAIPIATLPETFAPILLDRKTKRLRKETGIPTLRSADSIGQPKKLEVLKTAIWRPLILLTLEPIVTLVSLYVALMSGILYLYFYAYPTIFRKIYHMEQGNAGLAFIATGLGIVLATITSKKGSDIYLARKAARGGIALPEDRLLFAIGAAFAAPISIFWFAWSSRADVHWMSPIVSGLPFGWSTITLFICLLTFLGDSYTEVAASCISALVVLRSVFSVIFPTIAPYMFDNLEPKWALTLLGCLTVLFTPIPLLFYFFGARIRRMSKRTTRK